MASNKTIYCIHAADASQHFGKFQQLASKFKAENRITEFIPLTPEEANQRLTDEVNNSDLIVIMLTESLNPKLKELRNFLKQLQKKTTGIRISEIIIDNIPYENEFITLPHNDDKPVRDRDDMDQVWMNIEKDLETLFPKSSFQWKKVIVPVAA